MYATLVDVVCFYGTALVRLEYRLIKRIVYWFAMPVLGKTSKIAVIKISIGFVAGNNLR